MLFLNVYLLAVTPPYAIDFLKSLANRRYVKDFEKEYLVSYTSKIEIDYAHFYASESDQKDNSALSKLLYHKV